ncbi:MAG: cytochrome c-type biogenesis protein CcmH [Crocinitomicaceae bacterium]|jgi:cytochrome c-type biogenesis protein CcmH
MKTPVMKTPLMNTLIKKSLASIVVFFALGMFGSAYAAIDAYPFPTDEQRNQYNSLIAELRCPQCLNTNIAGSDAMIARDLRREVHRLVLEGQSDTEVREFMLARYGDFILYKPQLKASTVVLWFGPLVFLLIALGVIYRMVRRRQEKVTVLNDDDQARLQRMLSK